ncbi:hypothetical protein ACLB1Q_26360 [Escherichia coli]
MVGAAILNPVYRWLIIIVFNCQAGTPGENRFGPDPKLEPCKQIY